MKKKFLLKLFVSMLLVVSAALGVGMSNAADIDDSNQDFVTSNPAGSANPGMASYSPYAQMWKITVFAAKKDTVTNSDAYTLTEDYHKFGETFWLYGDGMGVEQVLDYGVAEEKIYLELHNKEAYVNQGATFVQARYSDLKSRVFKDSELGLAGDNEAPMVHNFPSGNDTTAEMKRFFEGNKTVSNAFIVAAAKAAGESPETIMERLTFTINGETKSGWNLNMVDVRTDTEAAKARGGHTSCVSWVFLYEPVIIIDGTNITGFYHGVTASGISAAMIQGVYNFTSSVAQFKASFADSGNVPSSVPVTWGLGRTFPFSKMPNAVFLAEDWLGYKSGAYWISENGNSSNEWYVESQFSGGGFGLRYQRAVIPKVVFQKTINGGTENTLSKAGFKLTVTDNSTGEQWQTVTDENGRAALYLPSGEYTVCEETSTGYEEKLPQIFTVPDDATEETVVNVTVDNTTLALGTLHISKVASDLDYSGVSFTVSGEKYESFTVDFSKGAGQFVLYEKEGTTSSAVSYTVTEAVCGDGKSCKRLNIFNLPVGEYTVTEHRPPRYGKTLSGSNHVGQTESLSYRTTVIKNTSQWVRFDNFVSECKVLVTKRIRTADIVFAHGTPVFFIKATCGAVTYTKNFVFNEEYVEYCLSENPGSEWVEMTVEFDEFGLGDTVSLAELPVMRYRLCDGGAELLQGEGSIDNETGTVLLTLNENSTEAEVRFTNEKTSQCGTSHNYVAVNEF